MARLFCCVVLLLAFLGGSNAEWPLEGARKQGRALLQGTDTGSGPETGCDTGQCDALLKPGCAWLTYPSGGPNEKSCKTADPFTVSLNNCFANIDSLAYVSVIAPAGTGPCALYGPGGTQAYKSGSVIAEVLLKCNQDVLIFAKGKFVTGSTTVSTIVGDRKNPAAGCRGTGGSTKLCDTCRFRPSLTCGDNVVANKQVCRPARVGFCENDALCSNTNALCPENPLKTDTTFVCRGATKTPAQGGCDKAETCDGINKECPVDRFDTVSTCRASAGECDPAETCDGKSATCPDNTKTPSGTPCGTRTLDGPCDAPDTCDGDSPLCADKLQNANFVCNPKLGQGCDDDSTCDGTTKTCHDHITTSPVLCRKSTNDCLKDALCDGTSANCPANTRYGPADNKECRPAVGGCDNAEKCDGTSDDCPPDVCVNDGRAITSDNQYGGCGLVG